MANIGPDLLGGLSDMHSMGFRIRPKGWVKKAGRGISKGAKGAYKGGKFAVKTAAKVSVAPLKLTGALLQATLKLAAKPIRHAVKKLAMRRAHYLAWRHRKAASSTPGERAQGVAYALAKLKRNPLGKMGILALKMTGGTKVAGDLGGKGAANFKDVTALFLQKGSSAGESIAGCEDCSGDSETGIAPAIIAANAAAIVAAVASIMRQFNKPGEAPENPRSGDPIAQRNMTEIPDEQFAQPGNFKPMDSPMENPVDNPEEDPTENDAEVQAGFGLDRTLGAWGLR
jgi:hypothetical protein